MHRIFSGPKRWYRLPHYAFRKTDVPPGSADTFSNLVCHRYLNLVLVVPVLPGGTARGTQVLNLVLEGSFVRDLDGCSRVHPVCMLVLNLVLEYSSATAVVLQYSSVHSCTKFSSRRHASAHARGVRGTADRNVIRTCFDAKFTELLAVLLWPWDNRIPSFFSDTRFTIIYGFRCMYT